AVLRKMTPKPKAMRVSRAMNRPVNTTARTAPGDEREADGAPPERIPLPRKKQRKLNTSQNTTVSTAVTAILVARRKGRFGVAARVDRIVPLAYSPVISSAPNTPPARATGIMPIREVWVGSQPNEYPPRRFRSEWATRPVTKSAATTVKPRVMAVDRRVTTLAISDRTTCLAR